MKKIIVLLMLLNVLNCFAEDTFRVKEGDVSLSIGGFSNSYVYNNGQKGSLGSLSASIEYYLAERVSVGLDYTKETQITEWNLVDQYYGPYIYNDKEESTWFTAGFRWYFWGMNLGNGYEQLTLFTGMDLGTYNNLFRDNKYYDTYFKRHVGAKLYLSEDLGFTGMLYKITGINGYSKDGVSFSMFKDFDGIRHF